MTKIHDRRSNRLKDHDYSQPGIYYVTICTKDRERLFGMVKNGRMILNGFGSIVKDQWTGLSTRYPGVYLDEFVIMPDHLHGIVVITNAVVVGAIHESPLQHNESPLRECDIQSRRQMLLSKMIGYFKTNSAKQINIAQNSPGMAVWQRNYYDHIIRDNRSLDTIRTYIKTNPINWC